MLNFEELDHEFLTEGSPAVDKENAAALIQKNLTPEEQGRLKEIMPIVEEASSLLYKAQTGQFPEDEQKMDPITSQGMPSEEAPARVVPQEGQMQQEVPSRSVEREMPQNAPEMMAIGGDTAEKAVQQQKAEGPGQVAAGPVGMVDAPGADESGVADDVPMESDGFVINAAAVEHAGLKDIYNMIKEAVEYLEENGVSLNTKQSPVSAEKILVSNGEVVIPDVIARVIGYDKLEKINNRGKEETEEKIAQQEEVPPQQPTPPVLQDQMAGLT